MTTSHCHLRPAQHSDLCVLMSIRNNRELQTLLMANAKPNTESDVRAWIDRRTKDPAAIFRVIARSSDDDCVGFVQVVGIDPVSKNGKMGIAIESSHARRGYGRAAISLLEHLFRDNKLVRKLTLEVLCENHAARSLYRSSGYREVGVLRSHFRCGETFHDVCIMEKLLDIGAGEGNAGAPR